MSSTETKIHKGVSACQRLTIASKRRYASKQGNHTTRPQRGNRFCPNTIN
ncbi:MAG: hypothetical protein WCQ95_04560 [Bacteroidota bacterium]